jgi:SAM-dependent methyltransferase
MGCGTGSLTFILPEFANVSAVVGVDLVEGYVEFAKSRNKDPRIAFQQGDACNLPFEDKSFDRAFSMLVLHFVPDSVKALTEMRRVVRPGGTITAAVWDEYGGLPHYRILVDIAATLDPSVEPRAAVPNALAAMKAIYDGPLWGPVRLANRSPTQATQRSPPYRRALRGYGYHLSGPSLLVATHPSLRPKLRGNGTPQSD